MDVVYVVRKGDNNPELRYSLRSLTNLQHDRVWLVGHKPSWATNVAHLPTPQTGTRNKSTTTAVRQACAHPQLSENIALFNDDFFVMRPLDAVPVLHRGTIEDFITYSRACGSNTYADGAEQTAQLLRRWGHHKILSYEVHAPMVINRPLMVDLLDKAAGENIPVLHKRTLYGNVARIGGTHTDDPKVFKAADERPWWTWPMLSTDDSSFRRHPVGRHIREAFPEPGPYEITDQ